MLYYKFLKWCLPHQQLLTSWETGWKSLSNTSTFISDSLCLSLRQAWSQTGRLLCTLQTYQNDKYNYIAYFAYIVGWLVSMQLRLILYWNTIIPAVMLQYSHLESQTSMLGASFGQIQVNCNCFCKKQNHKNTFFSNEEALGTQQKHFNVYFNGLLSRQRISGILYFHAVVANG